MKEVICIQSVPYSSEKWGIIDVLDLDFIYIYVLRYLRYTFICVDLKSIMALWKDKEGFATPREGYAYLQRMLAAFMHVCV